MNQEREHTVDLLLFERERTTSPLLLIITLTTAAFKQNGVKKRMTKYPEVS